jgi:hypothetical protein
MNNLNATRQRYALAKSPVGTPDQDSTRAPQPEGGAA